MVPIRDKINILMLSLCLCNNTKMLEKCFNCSTYVVCFSVYKSIWVKVCRDFTELKLDQILLCESAPYSRA